MEGQTTLTRRSKVTGLQDAARRARDALRERPDLCLGGLFKQGRPVALVRGLHLSWPNAQLRLELLARKWLRA